MIREILKSAYSKIPGKRGLFLFLRRFLVLPESIYRHLHFEGDFETLIDGRPFIMRHYGYRIENEVFWRGLTDGFEGTSMDLWIKLCRRSNRILDVGANTGLFSLVAKAANPKAKVAAFEPVERIFEKLKSNCERNSFDVECHQLALSNRDGMAELPDPGTEHLYSVSLTPSDAAAVNSVLIRVMRIATFLAENPSFCPLELLKIDVELHEPEVLEGMGFFLREHRPTILIEVLTDSVAVRLEGLLAGMGYKYFNIGKSGKPKLQDHLSKSDDFNFLICSDTLAKDLGLI